MERNNFYRLSDLLKSLLHDWWIFILCIAVGSGIAGICTYSMRSYSSSSSLHLVETSTAAHQEVVIFALSDDFLQYVADSSAQEGVSFSDGSLVSKNDYKKGLSISLYSASQEMDITFYSPDKIFCKNGLIYYTACLSQKSHGNPETLSIISPASEPIAKKQSYQFFSAGIAGSLIFGFAVGWYRYEKRQRKSENGAIL